MQRRRGPYELLLGRCKAQMTCITRRRDTLDPVEADAAPCDEFGKLIGAHSEDLLGVSVSACNAFCADIAAGASGLRWCRQLIAQESCVI